MTVYILGGGPAGLAVAHGLMEANSTEFVLIERGKTLGGLAQTVRWGDHGAHDLGPHKLFTLNPQLRERVEALLPSDDWLTREKISSIFLGGHFLPYPPSPLALMRVFGYFAFSKMTASYALARIRQLFGSAPAVTFEEDLRARVGSGLYEALFSPIAWKLWGDPARLDVKLSRGRVQTPKLAEVVGRLAGIRKKSEFEALTFRYPRGGLQQLWDAIQRRCEKRGTFLLNHAVEAIDTDNMKVSNVRCRRADGTSVSMSIKPDDFVASTVPIGLLSQIMKDTLSVDGVRLCRDMMTLNDLLLVFIHIDRPSLFDESWIFVPDPSIAFHRVSEQKSFDPGMTPNGSIMCCEMMSSEERSLSTRTDAELSEMALKGLAEMGYAGFHVLDTRVIRLPKSYPVFRPGFQTALNRVLAEFDSLTNFRTIGRQGAFNYIGTMDAMDIGYGFAAWLAGEQNQPWAEERIRTSHYPVLD